MKRWAAFAITSLLTQAAAAHHSTSMYAKDAPITIEAEVVEFRWVNPHSQLTVVDTHDASRKSEATLADGRVMTYSVELPTE